MGTCQINSLRILKKVLSNKVSLIDVIMVILREFNFSMTIFCKTVWIKYIKTQIEYWVICILLKNIYDDTLKRDDIGVD